jgi:hypothetical protein
MSEAQIPQNNDRTLERALTNKIIDDYFDNSEGWLRAILRMCIFSLANLDGKSVLIVECPNQAVAKRLSRKISPFRGLIYYLTDNLYSGDRTLFCYQNHKDNSWHCFDSSTNLWGNLSNLRSHTTQSDEV